MAKPIHVAMGIAATVGVGGVFLAGYWLGRSSVTPVSTAAPAPSETESEDDATEAPSPPPRRKRTAPSPRPTPSPTASPVASLPDAGHRGTPLHASPDPDSPVVLRIQPGTRLVVVETQKNWRRVEATSLAGAMVVGWIAWTTGRPASSGGTPPGPGEGVIRGVIRFEGRAPEMKVPAKRGEAEFCKDQPIPSDAVIVRDGKLADALVRIGRGQVSKPFPVPEEPVRLDQTGCMYSPRIQGARVGQALQIWNSDPTLHNAHGYRGVETAWNKAQVRGAGALDLDIGDADILTITCDVHPWMRAFVIATDHPFFAVTGEDGAFQLSGVPVGSYTLEIWHARYGKKTKPIAVREAQTLDVDLSYRATDPAPPENQGELNGSW